MSLKRGQLRRGLRLSVADAIFYSLMVGFGEVFFVADGVRLGASLLDLGLLVSLPLCLGATGPLIALALLARIGRRRPIVVAGASGQAACLAALSAAEFLDALTPSLLIALAVLYQVFNQASGSVWSSWYGDLVPARIRGRFFSRRSRAAQVASGIAVLAGGATLHGLEPTDAAALGALGGGSGFALIFAIAAACRVLSAAMLALSPEPEFGGLPSVGEAVSHLRRPDARVLRRLVTVAIGLQLTVYIGSPYFAPFMLEELRLSYAEYTAATMAVLLAKAVTLSGWGHEVDRHGARIAYALAAMLIALIPLPWVLANGLALVLVAQCMSGFSWGGHEVAHFSLVLETTAPRLRPHLFAVLNAVNGGAQLVGSLVGGALLATWDNNYRYLFVATMVGRFAVAASIPVLIEHVGARARIGRRQLLVRVVGFRPSGGIEARPLPSGWPEEPGHPGKEQLPGTE